MTHNEFNQINPAVFNGYATFPIAGTIPIPVYYKLKIIYYLYVFPGHPMLKELV